MPPLPLSRVPGPSRKNGCEEADVTGGPKERPYQSQRHVDPCDVRLVSGILDEPVAHAGLTCGDKEAKESRHAETQEGPDAGGRRVFPSRDGYDCSHERRDKYGQLGCNALQEIGEKFDFVHGSYGFFLQGL